jgi:hypothetical protein
MIKLGFSLENAMGIEIEDAASWSSQTFGHCAFGDARLTKRLVQIGAQLSSNIGESLASSCEGTTSKLEGSYRFIRNKRVEAEQIGLGGYEHTAKLAQEANLLLAIEDTTTLSYSHTVRKELGLTGRYRTAYERGYIVHTTMLMAAETEKTLGLIAQERWCRDESSYGKSHDRKSIAYEEKESYKWEKNTLSMEKLLGDKLGEVISICDREADIYEYMQYKIINNQRFIVRAKHDRILELENEKLRSFMEKRSVLGTYSIEIEQKSGRKKRTVEIQVKVGRVTIIPPQKSAKGIMELIPIELNVVVAYEINSDIEEPLEWILLTTEDITDLSAVRKITRYYELRWRIEDFHKAWKSGTNVEGQRMQSAKNLEKMIVVLSFVAIRLLQLKENFEQIGQSLHVEVEKVPCNKILSEIEWKVLWKTVEKKELPLIIPNSAWAYKAIARLGGWCDSKGTGKAAWATIWSGFFRLRERVEGYRAATS